jgi:hypothetical protein
VGTKEEVGPELEDSVRPHFLSTSLNP